MNEPKYLHRDKNYPWQHGIDYRKNPDLYQIGKGQQGVTICEPYKSEIVQHWRFRTVEIAEKSANTIYTMFLDYLDNRDFVGADMAKKYLHMGFTRARRYANHKSGTKWQQLEDGSWQVLPLEEDRAYSEKARAAIVFKEFWQLARINKEYLKQKKIHKDMLNSKVN